MRFVRIGALFLSLVLIAATVTMLIARRQESGRQLDRRAIAAASIARTAVEAEIVRAVSIVGVASRAGTTDSSELDPVRLTESFVDAAACWGSGPGSCTGPDLTALRAVGQALRLLAGDTVTVALVDEPSSSIVVIGSGQSPAILQIRSESLAAVATSAASREDPEASVTVELFSGSADEVANLDIGDSAGRHDQQVIGDPPLVDGAVRILSTAPGGTTTSRTAAAVFAALPLHVDHDQRRAGGVEVEGEGQRARDPRHQACPPMWCPISARLAVAAGVS